MYTEKGKGVRAAKATCASVCVCTRVPVNVLGEHVHMHVHKCKDRRQSHCGSASTITLLLERGSTLVWASQIVKAAQPSSAILLSVSPQHWDYKCTPSHQLFHLGSRDHTHRLMLA